MKPLIITTQDTIMTELEKSIEEEIRSRGLLPDDFSKENYGFISKTM